MFAVAAPAGTPEDVVQTLNTALQLHLTQSALSAQIARLETQVGARLFERTTRSVALTPAGLAFSEYAVEILHQTGLAIQTVQLTQCRPPSNTTQHSASSLSVAQLPLIIRSRINYPDRDNFR